MARSAGVEPAAAWFAEWFLVYVSIKINMLQIWFVAKNTIKIYKKLYGSRKIHATNNGGENNKM